MFQKDNEPILTTDEYFDSMPNNFLAVLNNEQKKVNKKVDLVTFEQFFFISKIKNRQIFALNLCLYTFDKTLLARLLLPGSKINHCTLLRTEIASFYHVINFSIVTNIDMWFILTGDPPMSALHTQIFATFTLKFRIQRIHKLYCSYILLAVIPFAL